MLSVCAGAANNLSWSPLSPPSGYDPRVSTPRKHPPLSPSGERVSREESRFVSPSLRASAGDATAASSYEIKFLLESAAADAIEAHVRASLRPDPHGDPALGGAYSITTVYLDTPAFDVFHRARELDGAKCRVRRYGRGDQVYLERKRRKGNRVQKRRSGVEGAGLEQRLSGAGAAGWAGEWFREEVEARGFRPVCSLTYLRTAFFGTADEKHFRLTIDRGIMTSRASGWTVEPAGTTELLRGKAVCEMKFREAMPQPLKALVARFGLLPAAASKYRAACLALGLVPDKGAADA